MLERYVVYVNGIRDLAFMSEKKANKYIVRSAYEMSNQDEPIFPTFTIKVETLEGGKCHEF